MSGLDFWSQGFCIRIYKTWLFVPSLSLFFSSFSVLDLRKGREKTYYSLAPAVSNDPTYYRFITEGLRLYLGFILLPFLPSQVLGPHGWSLMMEYCWNPLTPRTAMRGLLKGNSCLTGVIKDRFQPLFHWRRTALADNTLPFQSPSHGIISPHSMKGNDEDANGGWKCVEVVPSMRVPSLYSHRLSASSGHLLAMFTLERSQP